MRSFSPKGNAGSPLQRVDLNVLHSAFRDICAAKHRTETIFSRQCSVWVLPQKGEDGVIECTVEIRERSQVTPDGAVIRSAPTLNTIHIVDVEGSPLFKSSLEYLSSSGMCLHRESKKGGTKTPFHVGVAGRDYFLLFDAPRDAELLRVLVRRSRGEDTPHPAKIDIPQFCALRYPSLLEDVVHGIMVQIGVPEEEGEEEEEEEESLEPICPSSPQSPRREVGYHNDLHHLREDRIYRTPYKRTPEERWQKSHRLEYNVKRNELCQLRKIREVRAKNADFEENEEQMEQNRTEQAELRHRDFHHDSLYKPLESSERYLRLMPNQISARQTIALFCDREARARDVIIKTAHSEREEIRVIFAEALKIVESHDAINQDMLNSFEFDLQTQIHRRNQKRPEMLPTSVSSKLNQPICALLSAESLQRSVLTEEFCRLFWTPPFILPTSLAMLETAKRAAIIQQSESHTMILQEYFKLPFEATEGNSLFAHICQEKVGGLEYTEGLQRSAIRVEFHISRLEAFETFLFEEGDEEEEEDTEESCSQSSSALLMVNSEDSSQSPIPISAFKKEKSTEPRPSQVAPSDACAFAETYFSHEYLKRSALSPISASSLNSLNSLKSPMKKVMVEEELQLFESSDEDEELYVPPPDLDGWGPNEGMECSESEGVALQLVDSESEGSPREVSSCRSSSGSSLCVHCTQMGPPVSALVATKSWGQAAAGTDASVMQGCGSMATYEMNCVVSSVLQDEHAVALHRERSVLYSHFVVQLRRWCGLRDGVNNSKAHARFLQENTRQLFNHLHGSMQAKHATYTKHISSRFLPFLSSIPSLCKDSAKLLNKNIAYFSCIQEIAVLNERWKGIFVRETPPPPSPQETEARFANGLKHFRNNKMGFAVGNMEAEYSAQYLRNVDTIRWEETHRQRKVDALLLKATRCEADVTELTNKHLRLRHTLFDTINELETKYSQKNATTIKTLFLREEIAAEKALQDTTEYRLTTIDCENKGIKKDIRRWEGEVHIPVTECAGLCGGLRTVSFFEHSVVIESVEKSVRVALQNAQEQSFLHLLREFGLRPVAVAVGVDTDALHFETTLPGRKTTDRTLALATTLTELVGTAVRQTHVFKDEAASLTTQCKSLHPTAALNNLLQQEAEGRRGIQGEMHSDSAVFISKAFFLSCMG